MLLAVFPLGRHLVASAKTGVPFDASPIGYNTGKSEDLEKILINLILEEASQIAESIGTANIDNFDVSLYQQILE